VIQQIVFGIASGGIYASLALALVLIYRAMDVVNFAQGEMAMFSTFIAWTLISKVGLPYYVVFPATILIAMAGGILVQRIVIRPVERAPVLSVVIVTLGLFAVFNGLAGLIWGYVFKTFPSPFPARPVQLGGVYVGIQDLGLIAVSLLVLVAVFLFFQRTRLGLAMRSAALYPEASRLLGVRVSWMLALGWGLASAVGAISGMMIAPIVFLSPGMMQPVLLYAFAAAVLGGIDNPVGAVVGGLIVGVLLALIGTYVPGARDLRLAIGLVLIVGVLVVRPGGLLGRAQLTRV
jgi:branched-chain amino acid transport system permease protein